MNAFVHSRSMKVLLLVLLVLAITTGLVNAWGNYQQEEFEKMLKGKAPTRKGEVQAEVINASPFRPVSVAAAPTGGFTPQTRLGFTTGDQWEPAIAADRFGHVYVLYPQYLGVPGCPTCPNPTMILQISRDRGATWASPTQIAPPGTGQYDAQIVVDPIDGRTVYAAWLQNGKSDTVVAKSTDFGVTWSVVVANSTNAATDKPILAVRGQDVYVGYNHAQKVWVSSSHDGGATFTSVNVNRTGAGKLGWSLAGGGTVDPAGNVYFAWAGYEQNGGAKGPVNLFISKSTDGGATWTNTLIDASGAPPDCSNYLCGWAYLGAQITMASDSVGTLYALWNAGTVDKGPERIYFAKSSDAGATWSAEVDVSLAPAEVDHAFPAIVAGGAGDVRISWMDARAPGPLWNTYYRSSMNGGANWSAEVDLSTFVEGFSYIFPDGFSFPFGDYYEMDIDDRGKTHAVWGEGLNYDSPGSIWYVKGK
ncbi:MAG TPA: sialidase family protein [Anaerolineales bacterium]